MGNEQMETFILGEIETILCINLERDRNKQADEKK